MKGKNGTLIRKGETDQKLSRSLKPETVTPGASIKYLKNVERVKALGRSFSVNQNHIKFVQLLSSHTFAVALNFQESFSILGTV